MMSLPSTPQGWKMENCTDSTVLNKEYRIAGKFRGVKFSRKLSFQVFAILFSRISIKDVVQIYVPYSGKFSRVLIFAVFADQHESAKIFTSNFLTCDPYHLASQLRNLGVWLCLNAYPRKLKREKLENPTPAKVVTLENFPLYGSQSGSCLALQSSTLFHL